jgi:hypothetical protein
MRPNAWYPAVGWRAYAAGDIDAHLARVAERTHPNPPAARQIRVRALTANWCMAGQPVTPGEIYAVSENEVVSLEMRGKARRV